MIRRRLSRAVVAAIDASKILGVRAGARSTHRFIGVWPVVVEGRVFVRSWARKLDGWYHTFLTDSAGAIQIGSRTIRIRAVPTRSTRIRDAIERAYAARYGATQKFVRGFRSKRRRDTTLELVPR